MHSDLIHRPARDSDFSAIHALLNHPEINYQLSFDGVRADQFRPIFDYLCAADFRVVELPGAPTPNHIVATYRLQRGTHRLAHVVHLGTVAIHPDFHRQGLGRRIVTTILHELRRTGLHRVELTTSADNPRGLAFWQAMGFVIEGRYRDYFTRAGQPGFGEEIAMALILNEWVPRLSEP